MTLHSTMDTLANIEKVSLRQLVHSCRGSCCDNPNYFATTPTTPYVSRSTLNSIISQRPGTADTQRTRADHSVHKALGVRWLAESTLLLVQTSTWFYLATYTPPRTVYCEQTLFGKIALHSMRMW